MAELVALAEVTRRAEVTVSGRQVTTVKTWWLERFGGADV
jgi:hypothetical protein